MTNTSLYLGPGSRLSVQAGRIWLVHGSEANNREFGGALKWDSRSTGGMIGQSSHRTYLNRWNRLINEWKNAKRKTILVRLPQKPLGMVSGPLEACLLLGGGEDSRRTPTARGRALKVGMADFTLGHESGGRAANVFGRAVAATDLVRVDDFFAQSTWLLTTRAERDYVKTHCCVETWHGC